MGSQQFPKLAHFLLRIPFTPNKLFNFSHPPFFLILPNVCRLGMMLVVWSLAGWWPAADALVPFGRMEVGQATCMCATQPFADAHILCDCCTHTANALQRQQAAFIGYANFRIPHISHFVHFYLKMMLFFKKHPPRVLCFPHCCFPLLSADLAIPFGLECAQMQGVSSAAIDPRRKGRLAL